MKTFFLESTCPCVLGLGIEHSCPWPRECLSSERLSLALASDFFVSLALASSLVFSTPPLTVFNYRKSAGILFSPKNFKLSKPPFLLLGLDKVEFVDRVKYLGIIMDSSSNENCDISRQTRALYCVGNKLRSKFSLCSTYVKNILFKSYCMSLYGNSLWHNYNSYSIRRL